MSINLLLENETDPVIWRGPVISGVVQQFWTDVLWNCDYLFVDMPPGTGDVSLSVFPVHPSDGIIIVASPKTVGMVVEKAVKMAEMMNVPIVGLVENMSYVACPTAARRSTSSARAKRPAPLPRTTWPSSGGMPIDPALGIPDGRRASRISRVIGSRPSLTVWLKNKGSRAVFFHGAAFHGFLSVYGTHFHKVTNFPAIVFVGKSQLQKQ